MSYVGLSLLWTGLLRVIRLLYTMISCVKACYKLNKFGYQHEDSLKKIVYDTTTTKVERKLRAVKSVTQLFQDFPSDSTSPS